MSIDVTRLEDQLLQMSADSEPGREFCDAIAELARTGRFEQLRDILPTICLLYTSVKPYKKRLRAAQEATGLDDAILNAVGKLGRHSVVLSAMEYRFIGGSMGAVVGETIARAVDRARETRNPLIVVAASGGARMMEGVVLSLIHI